MQNHQRIRELIPIFETPITAENFPEKSGKIAKAIECIRELIATNNAPLVDVIVHDIDNFLMASCLRVSLESITPVVARNLEMIHFAIICALESFLILTGREKPRAEATAFSKILMALKSIFPNIKITSSIHRDLHIHVHPGDFFIFLYNLIKNCPHHGQATEIEVSLINKGSHHYLCIKDNGTGIDSERFPQANDIFIKKNTDGKGKGLGLRDLKERNIYANAFHNGGLPSKHHPNGGAMFLIEIIPIYPFLAEAEDTFSAQNLLQRNQEPQTDFLEVPAVA